MSVTEDTVDGSGFTLSHLTKVYSSRKRDVLALDDISLAVPQGSFTVLLGPSGCGKSTILRILADLESYSAGEVTIHGENPRTIPPPSTDWAWPFRTRLCCRGAASGTTSGYPGRSCAPPYRDSASTS